MGGTPIAWRFTMDNPIKMDDFEVPPFMETPVYMVFQMYPVRIQCFCPLFVKESVYMVHCRCQALKIPMSTASRSIPIKIWLNDLTRIASLTGTGSHMNTGLVVSNMTFIFHHIWDNPSHWHSYFSSCLKPPTRRDSKQHHSSSLWIHIADVLYWWRYHLPYFTDKSGESISMMTDGMPSQPQHCGPTMKSLTNE